MRETLRCCNTDMDYLLYMIRNNYFLIQFSSLQKWGTGREVREGNVIIESAAENQPRCTRPTLYNCNIYQVKTDLRVTWSLLRTNRSINECYVAKVNCLVICSVFSADF